MTADRHRISSMRLRCPAKAALAVIGVTVLSALSAPGLSAAPLTIALLATAAFGMLAPEIVSARGGGGGGHGGFGGFHGGGFHRAGGFGRGGFHGARFSRGFRFENFRHTGPHVGTHHLAKHMTGSRREVVHCLTSDCRLWHSYRD